MKGYPIYKNSGLVWLGQFPNHWKIKPFKRVFKERDERSLTGEEILLSVSAYTGVSPRSEIIDAGDHLSRAQSLAGYKICYVNDLVMNIMLAWNRGLAFTNYEGIVSPAYCVYQLIDDSEPKFLNYLVRSDRYIHYFKAFSAGVIDSRLRLYPDTFGQLYCCLPPPAEQRHIAAYLDREAAKIDKMVAEQQRLIELLKEKRQAVISRAVTKGLNPDAPMKPSGVEWLGDVPAHWAVKRLRHISPEITVGIVVEPSKYYTDEGIPALRSLNIRPGAMKLENLVFISESANELHKKSQLQAGDLVAVRSGQPGTTAIVPKEFDGCNCIDLIIVRKPAIDSEKFLCWYFASDAAVRQFSVGSDGAIQQHFNVGTAMNLVVSMPRPAEQDQIVDFIDRETSKLDSLVAEAQHAIGLLEERRSALISAAVTGQIDVRGLAERKAA